MQKAIDQPQKICINKITTKNFLLQTTLHHGNDPSSEKGSFTASMDNQTKTNHKIITFKHLQYPHVIHELGPNSQF